MDTPATDTPSSAPTESSAIAATEPSRPASAAEAFSQVTAEMDTETPAPTDTATTPPADAADPLSAKHGPIPFAVHDQALKNARVKASEEALAKHRETFGWAEQVNRADVEQAVQLARLYQTDRAGYIRQLLTEAGGDPQLGPVVRSEAARILAANRQAAPPSFDPDIPVYDDRGQKVAETFSAAKQRELITHMVAEALGKEVGPLKQDYESRQEQVKAEKERAEAEAFQQELNTFVTDTYQEAIEVLPGFKEHEKEISKVMETIPGDPAKAMRQAWKQVVGPTLEAEALTKVRASFTNKQNAQTVDGSGRAASTPARPKTRSELAAFMRQIG